MSVLTAYARPSFDEYLRLHQIHLPGDERSKILSSYQHSGEDKLTTDSYPNL